LWTAPEGFDDLFVANYSRLVAQAQQLSGGDRAAAEDLVQETIIRIALRAPDLRAIDKADAYIFATMRNVHLSEIRRRGFRQESVASLIDCDFLEASLLQVRADRQRQAAYDELTLIARYACLRKATSKAASALILRFFHGYYPTEIAGVLRTSEQAIDTWLRMARAEARAFIADPDRLRTISEPAGRARQLVWPRAEADFIVALRQFIFDSRSGPCATQHDLETAYDASTDDPLDAQSLAHIVSCPACLDLLNGHFGFPLLTDRDPSDMLGRASRSDRPKGER
jgi:RNA polymerase sigma factor (sigma-70 family)